MKTHDFDDHLPGLLYSHGKALARGPKFKSRWSSGQFFFFFSDSLTLIIADKLVGITCGC